MTGDASSFLWIEISFVGGVWAGSGRIVVSIGCNLGAYLASCCVRRLPGNAASRQNWVCGKGRS
ncbi:hypothetical protein SBA4_5080003 [Candidatus Sulfopaludibacter sp. SbA4]|nr:hypothetical protein SBA4_5080003 [Candidatus Sulfopaludibacter sp. SbA4]